MDERSGHPLYAILYQSYYHCLFPNASEVYSDRVNGGATEDKVVLTYVFVFLDFLDLFYSSVVSCCVLVGIFVFFILPVVPDMAVTTHHTTVVRLVEAFGTARRTAIDLFFRWIH